MTKVQEFGWVTVPGESTWAVFILKRVQRTGGSGPLQGLSVVWTRGLGEQRGHHVTVKIAGRMSPVGGRSNPTESFVCGPLSLAHPTSVSFHEALRFWAWIIKECGVCATHQ